MCAPHKAGECAKESDRGPDVTGALYRKTDPKIATAPKTESRSKNHNKDKDNSK